MATIMGRIESIREKTSSKGEEYKLVCINGNNYFDWQGHVAKAKVSEGDGVKAEVGEGRYPRLHSLEKAENSGNDSNTNNGQNDREVRISRLSCLRSAALLLATSDKEGDPEARLFELAQKMTDWVKK